MKTESSMEDASLQARLDRIERAVQDLSAGRSKQKDIWDKLSSLSALVSGIIVALIGGSFTYVYNTLTVERDAQSKRAQERLQELQVIEKFMPYLTSKDETSKRYAITAINTLANTEIATELAKLNPSTGVEQGLVAIVDTARSASDRQLAEAALAQVRCGVTDWSLKTLTDPDSSRVDTEHPVRSTVGELRQLKRPPQIGTTSPRQSEARLDDEKKIFVIQGRLSGIKVEASSDYSMVISAPDDADQTLTARIPDPNCARTSRFRGQFLEARKAVNRYLGKPPGNTYTRIDTDVEVQGVGYFTQFHGQTHLAPNGLELHPVLSVQFLAATKTR